MTKKLTTDRPALDALYWLLSKHEDHLIKKKSEGNLLRSLFFRAKWHPVLDILNKKTVLSTEQSFYPFAQSLSKRKLNVISEVENESYDVIFLLGSKNKAENYWYLLESFRLLNDSGTLFLTIENNYGSSSYRKLFKNLPFETEVKHKSKVFILKKSELLSTEKYLDFLTELKKINYKFQNNMHTHPAAFSWDKADKGSYHLLESSKEITLSGKVAELGSGYGYLSYQLLQKNTDITHFDFYEAERHSLAASRENFQDTHCSIQYFWHDVQLGLMSKDYDWIVMNPPYHLEKRHSIQLLQYFIEVASSSLAYGGRCLLVSQKQFKLKTLLGTHFKDIDLIGETRLFESYLCSN